MTQYTTQDGDFLRTNRHIYDVVYLANNVNGNVVSSTNPLPVTLGSENITITGNVTTNGTVNIGNLPSVQTVNGTVNIANTVQANVINWPATQNVNVNNTVQVITEEPAGNLFSFNNHADHTNRGWTMDNTMRPVVSVRVSNTATSITDLAQILEYEIGNNNAGQSTIIYEWYEGELIISGAAIPSWTSIGTKCQYRVYEDQYSSNQGNTFTKNSSIMRHSGIIIGKNSSGDEGPVTMKGGSTPNMLTLCMKRVDNATKLDIWFAFTIKELT